MVKRSQVALTPLYRTVLSLLERFNGLQQNFAESHRLDYDCAPTVTDYHVTRMTSTRVTIRDVAEAAQVSRMTVLRVLQNKPDVAPETRRRIMEVMERLGYAAATSDAQLGTSKVLGLLTPDIGTTPIGGILRGVSRATEHLGY